MPGDKVPLLAGEWSGPQLAQVGLDPKVGQSKLFEKKN